MSEDAIDAMIERAAREEQVEVVDLDRAHGQHILDMLLARNSQGADPLFEVLNRAHRAEAEEANQE